LDLVGELLESIGQLAYEIAAYTAIEKLLHARDGFRGCELGVNSDIAILVLQKRKLVILGQLLYQVQDEGWKTLASTSEFGRVPTSGD
jgi:hypothetical protein